MQGMIFAAGFGTRLRPFTDHHPKALAMVNGRTLLERNIEYLMTYGISDIVINVHYHWEQIAEFLDKNNNFGATIKLSHESGDILETGGGLVHARPLLGLEPLVLLNVDILTQMNLAEMIAYHNAHKPLATLAVSDRESSRKLMIDDQKRLAGWQNVSTGESIIASDATLRSLAFSGIHIVEIKLLDLITRSGSFSIMKVYMDLMHTKQILTYDHTGAALIDVGKPEAISAAEKIFE